MNIRVTSIQYITSQNRTNFYYIETIRNKEIEKVFSIEGKYEGSRTEYEVQKFLEEKLK